MKLVQMPVDLLHVDEARLPELGVDRRLLVAFDAYRAEGAGQGGTEWANAKSLAILAPPEAGTRALLMVLARRVGAALRDENIRARDGGGPRRGGKRLCYLPGRVLPEAFRSESARRTLASDAACFFQDLDQAWGRSDGSRLDPRLLVALVDARLASGRATFLSAATNGLPDGLERELRARVRVLEAA